MYKSLFNKANGGAKTLHLMVGGNARSNFDANSSFILAIIRHIYLGS